MSAARVTFADHPSQRIKKPLKMPCVISHDDKLRLAFESHRYGVCQGDDDDERQEFWVLKIEFLR